MSEQAASEIIHLIPYPSPTDKALSIVLPYLKLTKNNVANRINANK